jgi:hypothetical protein
VIAAMEASREADGGLDPAARTSKALDYFFERADKNPSFVKIFVRECYSESAAVQREIRRHAHNTSLGLRRLYTRLGEAAGIRLDTESLAVLVSHQIFSLLDYYVGLTKRERAEARPVLKRTLMQLMVGGVMAVKLPDEEAAKAAPQGEDATDGD